MQIALVNPCLSLDEVVLDVTSDVPPLGLMDIGTQLLRKGHKVKIFDVSVNRYSLEKTLEVIMGFNPDILGITALSSNFSFACEIAAEMKKRNKIPLVLGGVHASVMPAHCLETGLFDYVVCGEADESFPRLVESLERGENVNIPGVGYVKDDDMVFSEPLRPETIDKFYMRDWGLVCIEQYKPSPASYKELPAISTSISRGCPHHSCIFCASKKVFGKSYRSYSLEQVKKELEYFHEKKIKDINFVDINFTSDKKYTMDVCDVLKGFKFLWNITTRCDYVDYPLLKRMKESGCYQIGYGVEAGTQSDLDLINKNYTLEQIENAVLVTKKAGISVKCFFTLGFPWQKKENIRETVKFAKRLDPDIAIFSIINPYPGTKLFDEYSKERELVFSSMKHRSAENSISRYYDGSELTEMMNNANKQFYMRPKIAFRFVLQYLRKIKRSGGVSDIIKGLRYIINR